MADVRALASAFDWIECLALALLGATLLSACAPADSNVEPPADPSPATAVNAPASGSTPPPSRASVIRPGQDDPPPVWQAAQAHGDPTATVGAMTLVATASGIEWINDSEGVSSWSPDGRFFAFWEMGEDVYRPAYGYDSAASAGGTLRFLDQDRGEICTSRRQVGFSFWTNGRGALRWSADGRVILDGLVGWPCGDGFMAEPSATAGSADGELSPEGGFQVLDRSAVGDCAAHESELREAATGRLIVELAWKSESYKDAPCGVAARWVDEGSYLIPETIDRGPVLLSASQGAIALAESFVPEQEAHLLTSQALMPVDGRPAILIWFRMPGRPLRLYHLSSGELEVLPFERFLAASPDGRWLAVGESGAPESREAAIWIRPVSAAGEAWTPIRGEGLLPQRLRWSPDGARLAVAGPASVSVYRTPDGQREGVGSTLPFGAGGDEPVWLGPWSPDGIRLPVAAVSGQRTGLYVLDSTALELPR